MAKKQAYELAREAVAQLQAQLEAHKAAVVELDAEASRLESDAGAALADGLDTGTIEDRMAALALRLRTEKGAIGVLEGRLAEAKVRQREAVAAELQRQADEAEAEHAKVEAQVVALFEELQALGVRAMVHPDCLYMHARVRPEQLRRASEMVAASHPCPIDPLIGLPFDQGLW